MYKRQGLGPMTMATRHKMSDRAGQPQAVAEAHKQTQANLQVLVLSFFTPRKDEAGNSRANFPRNGVEEKVESFEQLFSSSSYL